MDLLVAAGRFLREVHGEPVANLLAVLAGGESSEPPLEQRVRVVEGLVQDHQTAVLELERTPGQQLQFSNIAVEGTCHVDAHARNTRLRITVPGPTRCRAICVSMHPSIRVSRASPKCASLVSSSLGAVISDLCCLGMVQ